MPRKKNLQIESYITPFYKDLFDTMLDPDPIKADEAFDKVLFERQKAVPALIEKYNLTPDSDIMRYYCVQLLGFSDSQESIELIRHALTDNSPLVRKEACFALEDLKAIDAIEDVRSRMQDLDPNVRQVACETYDFLLKLSKKRRTRKK